jgi:hypothetical protein
MRTPTIPSPTPIVPTNFAAAGLAPTQRPNIQIDASGQRLVEPNSRTQTPLRREAMPFVPTTIISSAAPQTHHFPVAVPSAASLCIDPSHSLKQQVAYIEQIRTIIYSLADHAAHWEDVLRQQNLFMLANDASKAAQDSRQESNALALEIRHCSQYPSNVQAKRLALLTERAATAWRVACIELDRLQNQHHLAALKQQSSALDRAAQPHESDQPVIQENIAPATASLTPPLAPLNARSETVSKQVELTPDTPAQTPDTMASATVTEPFRVVESSEAVLPDVTVAEVTTGLPKATPDNQTPPPSTQEEDDWQVVGESGRTVCEGTESCPDTLLTQAQLNEQTPDPHMAPDELHSQRDRPPQPIKKAKKKTTQKQNAAEDNLLKAACALADQERSARTETTQKLLKNWEQSIDRIYELRLQIINADATPPEADARLKLTQALRAHMPQIIEFENHASSVMPVDSSKKRRPAQRNRVKKAENLQAQNVPYDVSHHMEVLSKKTDDGRIQPLAQWAEIAKTQAKRYGKYLSEGKFELLLGTLALWKAADRLCTSFLSPEVLTHSQS